MGEKINDMQSNGIKMLLKYKENPSQALRNDIVMEYLYIPKVVASQMRGYTAAFAQVEDMVNQGVITLIECIDKYEFDKGLSFETYAYAKIKCANIDYLRKQDWLPRRVRKTAKDISKAYDELANKFMREPTIEEIAENLEVQPDIIKKHNSEIANSVMLSFEMILQGVSTDNNMADIPLCSSSPEEAIFAEELREQLKKAIDSINSRERTVISLYYYEHLRLAEIADIIGVSQSRVCQIHKNAIQKMRNVLETYMKG